MNGPPLLCKLLSEHGRAPVRATSGAAGYDLFSAEDVVLPARSRRMVRTDVAVGIPLGWYGRIAPRSGMAVKHHVEPGAGVIDSDYLGPVGMLLINNALTDYAIAKGDRCAQLILERCLMTNCEVVDELEPTARGEKGFGSTGKAGLPAT